MKKLLMLALALVLAGCGAPAPAAPTATPVVLVQTVVVTVVPTQAPTEVPTSAPPPTQPPQVVVVVTATSGNPPANVPSSGGTATATLPADAGGNLFTSVTRSGSFLSLRCLPQDITFSVSTSNLAVVNVDFYYRVEDLTTQPVTYSEWKNAGKMSSDKHGNFTIDFNVTQISPDFRATPKGWLDYQFVGLAKDANAVGRSGKISQQILYLKDCP